MRITSHSASWKLAGHDHGLERPCMHICVRMYAYICKGLCMSVLSLGETSYVYECIKPWGDLVCI